MKKTHKLILIGIASLLCVMCCLGYYTIATSPQRRQSRYLKFENERLEFLSKNTLALSNMVHISNQSFVDGYDYIFTRDEWFNKYSESCKDISLEARKIKIKNKAHEQFEKTVDNAQRLALIGKFDLFFKQEKSSWNSILLSKKYTEGEFIEFKSIFLKNHPHADLEKIYLTLKDLDIEIAKAMYAIAFHNLGIELNSMCKKNDRIKSFQVYEILYKKNYKSENSKVDNKTRYLTKTSIGLICFDENITPPNNSPEFDPHIAVLTFYNIPYTDSTSDAVKPIEPINPNEPSYWNYYTGVFNNFNDAGVPVYQRMLVVPTKYGGFDIDLQKIQTTKVLSNLTVIADTILPKSLNRPINYGKSPIAQYGYKSTQIQKEEIKKETWDYCTKSVYTISNNSTTDYTLSTLECSGGQIEETEYIFKNNKTDKFKQWKKSGPEFFVVTQFGIFSADSDGKIIILDDSYIN